MKKKLPGRKGGGGKERERVKKRDGGKEQNGQRGRKAIYQYNSIAFLTSRNFQHGSLLDSRFLSSVDAQNCTQ